MHTEPEVNRDHKGRFELTDLTHWPLRLLTNYNMAGMIQWWSMDYSPFMYIGAISEEANTIYSHT